MPVVDPNTQLAFSTVRLVFRFILGLIAMMWISWSVIPQLKEIAQIIWR